MVNGYRAPPFVALRTQTRLYVEYDSELDGVVDMRELYGLAPDELNDVADPHQMNSLHADERFKDAIEAMHARIEALRNCKGASCW
jgi:hypothetical protein